MNSTVSYRAIQIIVPTNCTWGGVEGRREGKGTICSTVFYACSQFWPIGIIIAGSCLWYHKKYCQT